MEENADDSAVDCSLREEVRELRAQLADLFLVNDDIRDRLNDLENDEGTEDAEEEKSADDSADDYYHDPGENLEAEGRDMELFGSFYTSFADGDQTCFWRYGGVGHT